MKVHKMGMEELVGLLGLLGAIGGGGQNPELQFLSRKKLVPLTAEDGAVEQFEKVRDLVAKLDPANVDSMALIVLHKPTAETPCACGELHKNESMTVTTSMIGEPTALKAMVITLANDLEQKVG